MSPYRVDARLSGRHPFELFTLYLAILTAVPTVLGIVPEPGSIRETLPPWMAVGWAWLLLVGASLAVAGVFWRDRGIGLVMEQFGLVPTGVASIAYAVCVLYINAVNALVPAAIIFGYGISCLWRVFQIQAIIDEAVTLAALQKRRGQ